MGNCQNLPESFSKKLNPKSKGPSNLIVSAFTWGRDSHGLFDYESKTLAKKVFKVPSAGVIRRNQNEIAFTKDNDKTVKQGDKDLVKLRIKEGSFWVDGCPEEPVKESTDKNVAVDSGSLEQDPWLVVKSYKNNTNKGYKLSEGETIKLGRIKYRIREIKGSPTIGSQKDNAPEKQVVNTEVDGNISVDESFKKSPRSPKGSQGSQSNVNQTCRICLSESCEADNPFFSPCNCSGTMKLIHVKCLQTWLKSKIQTKTTGHTTFTYWKTLECELCKTSYPQYFDVDNKRYDIVEIERPNSAYIMMEVLSKEKNVTRGVHLVKMEGKTNIRMGRGHDSDIRITDISVSRCHAVIKLEKGGFYIEDNNSKFGTLVHVSKPLAITGEMNNISLQVGRTVVTLTTKKGKGMQSCFGQGMSTSVSDKNAEQALGLFGDLNIAELASPTILQPNSPLSPVQPNSALGPRDRTYRIDFISHISHLNTENIIPLVMSDRPIRFNNGVLQQNMGEPANEGIERIEANQGNPVPAEGNDGNVGAEAEERSLHF